MMNISIIICTHNRQHFLKDALRSLFEMEMPEGCNVELIVVNNASTDNTKSAINNFSGNGKLHLRSLFEPRIGKTFALNKAISSALGDILALVDDDHIASKVYLKSIYKALEENPSYTIFCGRILPNWDNTEPDWVHDSTKYPIRPFPIPQFDLGEKPFEIKNGNGFIPGAGNLIVKKSVFERVGLFSEHLGPKADNLCGGEDIEFVNRAMINGESLFYDPMILQYHQVDKSRLNLPYLIKKGYLRSKVAYQFSGGHLSGKSNHPIPAYLIRQAITRFLRAASSFNPNARRYYLVRFAATLGEINGRRKALKSLSQHMIG
jgi:glycosyltransferase involved in cell wall biosynthesis